MSVENNEMRKLRLSLLSVTSLDRWTYPPFDGVVDGEWIYGRGSGDCKNNVIGILTAVEHLIQSGWIPYRTIGNSVSALD